MSGLARMSLANRMLAALLTVVVVVFGVIATLSMRVELFPSMEAPAAGVIGTYPGASPQVMEREIAEPLEAAVENIDDLDTVQSTSSNGQVFVDLLFDLDADAGDALDEVRENVNEVRSDLPDEAEIDVLDYGGGDDADLVLALAATADEDAATLSSNLQEHVLPELENLSGVREVQTYGERDEVVQIEPDEDELEDEGLSHGDLVGALQDAGLITPGGTLTDDERTLSITVGEEFSSLEDIEELYLMPQAGAAQPDPAELMAPGAQADEPEPVRLGDLAEVSWGETAQRTISRGNGAEAISLVVYKEREANIVEVSHNVEDALPELGGELGEDGDLFITVDTAPFIEDSIDGLVEKGVIGLVIVIGLILTFLLSVRTTIVTAVSIPLSLLIALIAMWGGGYTLNMLTLAGLTVAIGRVVDDSIVVLENIKRHLSYGGERVAAILTAVREVAGAITAATLATAAVFLPIAFMGGIVSIFFESFAVTVAVALIASLIVSLTIIPVLAYWFVRSDVVPEEDRERVRVETEEKERRSWLQRGYIPVLSAATRRGEHGWTTWRRWAVLGAGLLVLIATLAMTPNLRFILLEDDGQNQLVISQELPAGTSLEAADTQAEEVEEVLDAVGEVESYETTVGSADGFTEASNQASYWVTVDPGSEVEEVREELQERIDELPDAGEVTVSSLMQMGAGAGEEATADIRLLSEDSEALEEASEQVGDMMLGVEGVQGVSSDLTEAEPGIQVTPDAEEAAEQGVSDTEIAQAVQAAMDGMQAGTVLVGGSQSQVVIDTGDAPETLDELREYEIATPAGTVELDDIADVEEVERPVEIRRVDGERAVTVSAQIDSEADLQAVSQEITSEVDDMDLPSGVSTTLGGDAEELDQVLGDMGIALLTSIAIVFVIMVATFRSIAQPLILLVSVPFAATGALGALLLTGTPVGLPTMIGMLMLVGIVVTNAIVLIDLINQYRRGGMELTDAVIEGGRQRLRPILMTAIATIGALTPMAVGWGQGSVFIAQSLAIVVIGGLVSSTVLTLLILPALYMMLEEGKENRAERRALRRERRAERRAAKAATNSEPKAESMAAEPDDRDGSET